MSHQTLAKSALTSRVVVNGVLILTTVYFLFPVWWLIVSSTKSNPDLFASNGFWFADMNFIDNIKQVFTYDSGIYPRWFLNSIGYALVAALGSTFISAMCGYVLAKFNFRGRGLVFGFVMAGLLIPATLLTVPLYLVAAKIGLTNTIWSVIIPSVVSPFGVFLSYVYAQGSVPDEILESARVDGAGELKIFFQIVFHIMTPAMATVGLFSFVGAWNNFMLPLFMLNDRNLYPVTLGLFAWQSNKSAVTYNVVLAGSLLMVIPLVIGFLFLQRFWKAGLTLGAVKG
jgi:multiple sugar transport system permease protein